MSIDPFPLLWGRGWFPLTLEGINRNVQVSSKGAYILAKGPIVHKVRSGRSLKDLNGRLHDHRREGVYDCFRFEYANTEKEAYEKECVCYHAAVSWVKRGELIHPAHPTGKNYRCPVCGH